jgi:3-dehydroquinate dehydratase
MQYVIILAILSLVVMVVAAPLRRAAQDPAAARDHDATAAEVRLDELEAAREAKYREIRDADLDHSTGKLSDADYAELDQALRAEAIEILREIDHAQPA